MVRRGREALLRSGVGCLEMGTEDRDGLNALRHLRGSPVSLAVRAMVLREARVGQRLPNDHFEDAILVGAEKLPNE